MKSRDVMEQCNNLSYRKLDYWCQQGVFLNQRPEDRNRRRRDFTDEDLRIARVVAHVADVFNLWSGGRGGFVAIYREIANQIRTGNAAIQITLAPGIEITIALDALSVGHDEPLDVVEEPPAEVVFIPGVGVDNA